MDHILYHATRSDWLDFIFENGLKPAGPAGQTPKILLFRQELDARALAASVFGVEEDEACIIAVDARDLHLSPPQQPAPPLGQHMFATGAIPPQRLTLCPNL